MKLIASKGFKTPIGYFFFGYSVKCFGVGLRIDQFGVSGDFAWFWFGWER